MIVNSSKIVVILIHFLRKTMPIFQTQKQQNSILFVHYCLIDNLKIVIEGLFNLFLELNFNPRIMDFQKFYDSLKDKDFFPSLSILFLKIGGPFLTFETFKAFFDNLYLAGLLEFDMEEYEGKVEVRFLTLSKIKIGELVSQIKIVSSISLIQVFSHLSGLLIGGPITWLDLYNRDPSLKSFLDGKGKDKNELRNIVEQLLQQYGVAVEKHPHVSFTFPPNWGNTRSLLSFVLKLVSTIGFSEIPYVSDTLEKESPVQPVELFERLTRLFSQLKKFNIPLITNLDFLKPLCEISQTSQEQKKQIFALLVQFCFVIDNGIATPHPSFHIHVEHFVVAFMRISGVSLEGIQVQGTIKSGPTWVHKDGKKHIVCSSVATGKDCRNRETCRFLHSTTENGIITTHCGKVLVVCRENAKFDKTPPKSSLLCYNFKSGMVSIDSTHPVARGDSADPRAHAVACGGSANPETRVVSCGGSDEKREYRKQMLSLMTEELNAFDNPPPVDPRAVERFSLDIPPLGSGSHTDNIVRLIKSKTGDPDALLRTASTYVIAMNAKNAKN